MNLHQIAQAIILPNAPVTDPTISHPTPAQLAAAGTPEFDAAFDAITDAERRRCVLNAFEHVAGVSA